jgi:hypothetical protein
MWNETISQRIQLGIKMTSISAHAVRNGKTIEVTVSGSLPNSCHQAQVVDFYPGGSRVYITDPGAAQVFIEETVKPGSNLCLMMLVPWAATVAIPDAKHTIVEIFVNNHEVLEIPVIEKKGEFIVIALTGSTAGNSTGCSIIPKDALYLAIYSKMYGPDTYEKCQAWVTGNCGGI